MSKLYSIKAKIGFLVLGSVLITVIINLICMMPGISSNITNLTNSYLKDLAIGYGQIIDNACEHNSPETVLIPEQISDMLQNAFLDGKESSYAFVLASDGTVLYHPSAEKIGQPMDNDTVKDMALKLASGESKEESIFEYRYDGTRKIASGYAGKHGEFILFINANRSEVLESIRNLTGLAIFGAVVVLLLCLVSSFIVVGRITRPILQVTSMIERLSTLDFTMDDNQAELNGRRDETGSMSRAITHLREELGNVIYDLQEQSGKLYQFSKELNDNTEETIRTMKQVEQAAQDISCGATSQADETEQATNNVVTIGNMVEATNAKVEEIHKIVLEMQKNGNNAAEKIHELDAQNEKTKVSIQTIYDQTNVTNQSAEKIREATVLIASIAEETSLLSLNASIEAARAGEQGRGFAVVAAQIQRLAEQSNASTEKIEEIVTSLIEDSQQAVETMEEVRMIVENQVHAVEKTEHIFSRVQKGIQNTKSGVDAIAEHTQEMDEARIRVVDVVQNLTAIAEQNAASTEQTSASVSQVGTIVENIASDINKVKDVAQKLEENIKKFKL